MTTDAPSREELLAMIRESGVMDDLAEELRNVPTQQFAGEDEGYVRLEQGVGAGGFPWHYWKKRDGTVITGPEPRETLFRIYQKKGYRHMPEYGLLPTPGAPLPCCKGFMRTDQFHVLMAKGGAKELSVRQVLAAGWDINPPTVHGKVIDFPQLRGVEVERLECDECDKPIAGVAGTNQVVVALRQHGQAVHKFSRRDVDEMLYRIGYLDNEPRKAPVRRRVAEAEAVAAHVCDQCGATFGAAIALSGHKRSHK